MADGRAAQVRAGVARRRDRAQDGQEINSGSDKVTAKGTLRERGGRGAVLQGAAIQKAGPGAGSDCDSRVAWSWRSAA